MRNIDLTMDGAFSNRRRMTSSRISISPDITIIGDSLRQDNSVKLSEIEANFLVGSIDSINRRRLYLETLRSMRGIKPACERCGGDLVFRRDESLCQKCDDEMDYEMVMEKRMNNIFKS